jgi:hypothetical protein
MIILGKRSRDISDLIAYYLWTKADLPVANPPIIAILVTVVSIKTQSIEE